MTSLARYRFIVVEGPIGAGKTSLARRLAEAAGADLLLEEPETNPFLARFYDDPRRFALPTQLFFLFQRIGQLRDKTQLDLFNRLLVADFLFDKDPLFAALNLPPDELGLYQRIFDTLKPQAPKPDLVIYLQAPLATLTERIRRRGRVYEQSLHDRAGSGHAGQYLERLTEAYNRFFYHYEEAPVLMVNSERLNFVESEVDFRLLLSRIDDMRGRREYFNQAA